MLRGLAAAMMEQGYVGTSVADVLRIAKVSRETFYEHFSSKADCFMHAFEAAVRVLISSAVQARAPERDPMEQFDFGLRSYLETLAAEPAFARLFLLEIYAAGPEALRRRERAQQRFVDLVCDVFDARSRDERFAAEALVAMTSAMVTARLAANDLTGLRALREPTIGVARRLMLPPAR